MAAVGRITAADPAIARGSIVGALADDRLRQAARCGMTKKRANQINGQFAPRTIEIAAVAGHAGPEPQRPSRP